MTLKSFESVSVETTGEFTLFFLGCLEEELMIGEV